MRLKMLKKFPVKFGLLWKALKKFNEDNGFFLSSGIAFNILINLIPFILLLLALVGTYLYNHQEVINHIRGYLKNVAPTLDPKIIGMLMSLMESRKIVGILGFIGLIWFSTWVFHCLRIALNIVLKAEKNRGMLQGIGIDLLMILFTGIFLLVSLLLSSMIIFLQDYQGLIPVAIGPIIKWILKYLLPFFFSYAMFFLIYKIIPNKKVRISSALQAALFASLLWELAKHLFTWYVVHLAQYSFFYGSLSTLIIFVFWVFYSSTILLLGGEFVYFLEEDQ
ncbi:MAG: YihY/virulence factor BrkB family protein [Thermodesulfobacteriota bacterium]